LVVNSFDVYEGWPFFGQSFIVVFNPADYLYDVASLPDSKIAGRYRIPPFKAGMKNGVFRF
jgi:hypothetical protein